MGEASATQQAVREVEHLVRVLGEQLGQYRRRALAAEARVRSLEEERSHLDQRLAELAGERDALEQRVADARRAAALMEWPEGLPSPEQVAALRDANALLEARLEAVTQRTRALVDRVRFVRQQVTIDPPPAAEEREA